MQIKKKDEAKRGQANWGKGQTMSFDSYLFIDEFLTDSIPTPLVEALSARFCPTVVAC